MIPRKNNTALKADAPFLNGMADEPSAVGATTFNRMEETWKEVIGYRGKYKVSSSGQIQSAGRRVKFGRSYRDIRPIIMSQFVGPNGYPTVNLSSERKRKTHYVHRIVASAFIPNPERKKTINHKNGDKTDNRAGNLEWATQSENNLHSFRALGHNPKAKPVLQLTLLGDLVAKFPSAKAAQREGFQQSRISKCCNGESLTHRGYKWKYSSNL